MGFLSSRIEEVVGDEPLILAGHYVSGFGSLLKRRVLGCIVVHPEGFRCDPPSSIATLSVAAPYDDYSEVVPRLAAVLSGNGRIGPFLESIDPERTGVVVSANGVPSELFAGRRSWAPDGTLCGRLEAKVSEGAFLQDVLPWARSIPRPLVANQAWWKGICADFGCSGVVIQRTGASAGGIGTYLCTTLAQAVAALAAVGEGARLTPLLDGTTHNVMGFVSERGETMVLPVSRQVSFVDARRRPIYAGNVLGEEIASDEESSIYDDVRAAARRLQQAGFAGTFGLDFIRHFDGSRTYHDLNPRINGVVKSLNMCAGPVSEALMTAPGWGFGRLAQAEEEIAAAVKRHPMARWRLTGTFEPRELTRLPLSGTYRLDPEEGAMDWLGPSCAAGEVENDTAVLRTGLFPGYPLRSGQRLSIGDLFLSLETSSRLESMWGSGTLTSLIRTVVRTVPELV